MLKALNQVASRTRHQAAAWRRWQRKLPHNRVRRARLRDASGRVIGHGPSTPMPEPVLPGAFCTNVRLPSGRVEVVLSCDRIEAAYRLARRPMPAPEQVIPLAISEEEIRRLHQEHCMK